MERPNGNCTQPAREVTGEIVYLDEMRRRDQFAQPFSELTDMAKVMYEETADMYTSQGVRPAIMDEYERYESKLTPLYKSCGALAEELLRLKDPNSPATFVDIRVAMPTSQVLEEIKNLKVRELLEDDDAQLALPSTGEYYPELDIKKNKAVSCGTGVTVWGWQHNKHVMIRSDKGQEALLFPEEEMMSWYQIDVSFSYRLNAGTHGYSVDTTLVETLTLSIGTQGELRLSSNIWASEYAETGYEGHIRRALTDATEEDIAAFADFIAEIVGDAPESRGMNQDRHLQEYVKNLPTSEAREAVGQLKDVTGTAGTLGMLAYTRCGDTTLAKALTDKNTVDQAITIVKQLVRRRSK